MSLQLAQALTSAAILGAVVRPLLVATILFGLWHALARAKLGALQRLIAWSTVTVVLIGWLTMVWILALRGVFLPMSGIAQVQSAGTIVVPAIVLAVVALALLTRSSTIRAAIDAAPLWWLIAYQGYRVTGLVFIRLWSQGVLPGFFALPAGIGDMLTGVFAIVGVAAFLRNSLWARGLAYAVNIFGIVDLLNAISMGVLSTLLSTPNQPSPLLLYPLVIVPSFGVPLAFIVHCLSIWQLQRRGKISSAMMPRTDDIVSEKRVTGALGAAAQQRDCRGESGAMDSRPGFFACAHSIGRRSTTAAS
jgi:hypothetical protein